MTEQKRQAIEKAARRCAASANYLSDFPHHQSSVEYGFKKGAEFALSDIRKPSENMIDMAIANFDNIAKRCEKVTSGNFMHDVVSIKGLALRNCEYLKKHRNGKD